MNKKEKLTEKCEKCGEELPSMDKDGKPNFHLVGSYGNRIKLCPKCCSFQTATKPDSKGWVA
jgi:hypothetical protein